MRINFEWTSFFLYFFFLGLVNCKHEGEPHGSYDMVQNISVVHEPCESNHVIEPNLANRNSFCSKWKTMVR